ncbi:hypothetical protein BD311DRAFT_767383 [Dichomitus squalens]|uniref:Uncharacterized protein n=1 Tax=Dichomitus squalens TaxID=114155 RepID=A0A4Q9M9X9_9APHY|nr:hypothetical protein BD311DRAFT_767383 [Dichomitus squalens]
MKLDINPNKIIAIVAFAPHAAVFPSLPNIHKSAGTMASRKGCCSQSCEGAACACLSRQNHALET